MLSEVNLAGTQYIIVGTAHISKMSVAEVEAAISHWQPECVCIELCDKRLDAVTNPELWKNMDLVKAIRQGKTWLMLANILISGYQKKLGQQVDVIPGMEMIKSVELAKAKNLPVVTIDRDLTISLKRVWSSLSFLEKVKLFSYFIGTENTVLDSQEVERLKEQGAITSLVEELNKDFPNLKRTLLSERDQYMVHKIKQLRGYNKIMIIVGAAHFEGIKHYLKNPIPLTIAELTKVESRRKLKFFLALLVPLILVGIIGYGLSVGNVDLTTDALMIWVLLHSVPAGLGAALAFGHPLSILGAIVAAPITSLQPIVKSGWVAGIIEASMRKPKVRDFENIITDGTSIKGFYRNKITRALLVTLLTSFASGLGTLLSLPFLASIFKNQL